MRSLRTRLGLLSAAALTVGTLSSCAAPLVGIVPPSAGGQKPGGPGPGSGSVQHPQPGDKLTRCDQPAADADFERVNPEQVGLTAKSVTEAIEYADARGAQSVRIYRK
ncbi:MAG: hypothetical protein R2735_07170 [Microthrixaceae bacterium]